MAEAPALHLDSGRQCPNALCSGRTRQRGIAQFVLIEKYAGLGNPSPATCTACTFFMFCCSHAFFKVAGLLLLLYHLTQVPVPKKIRWNYETLSEIAGHEAWLSVQGVKFMNPELLTTQFYHRKKEWLEQECLPPSTPHYRMMHHPMFPRQELP